MNACEHLSFKAYIVKWKQYLKLQVEAEPGKIRFTFEHDLFTNDWLLIEIIKSNFESGCHPFVVVQIEDVLVHEHFTEPSSNEVLIYKMTKLDFFSYLENNSCMLCDKPKKHNF